MGLHDYNLKHKVHASKLYIGQKCCNNNVNTNSWINNFGSKDLYCHKGNEIMRTKYI